MRTSKFNGDSNQQTDQLVDIKIFQSWSESAFKESSEKMMKTSCTLLDTNALQRDNQIRISRISRIKEDEKQWIKN